VRKSTAFYTDQHIQFLINWLFCDKENTLLHPFHVVPLAVLAQVTNLFEGKTHRDTASSVIHRYCSENWMKLLPFMFFYVRNIGNYHWVLDVAVNPFLLVALASGKRLEEPMQSMLYGFFHLDPLDASNRDGTIPAKLGYPKDSPLHVREMTFLLNCMSQCRDLHVHGKHDTIKHLDTLEYIFAFGAAGPFGRVFEDKNFKLPTLIWNVVPESYFPQL
jgi:hypothetical protein